MSQFNKRHYESIATVCQEYRAHAACFETAPVRNAYQTEIEQRLADMFKADNGLFDRERFMHACRPGSNVKAKTAHLKAVR